jgi:predicted TIM-barrel fold metal-dependent hydrolase
MGRTLADAHLHVFRRGFTGRYGRGPYGLGQEIDAYEHFRAEHGIARGLIVGYEGSGIEPDNNAYIRELAATRPWMATLAYVAPEATPSGGAVETLLEQGHVGIAIYLPEPAATEKVLRWPAESWQGLNARRAIVSLNAVPPSTAALAPLIEANSRCTFLFSHLGLPGRTATAPDMDAARQRLAPLLQLAAFPNVLVKISGLYAISDPAHAYPHASAAPFLEILFERFGAARCCWGSDFSPALDFVSFAQAVDTPWLARLSGADLDRVMGGNVMSLLQR